MNSSGKAATRKPGPETTHLWGGSLCLDFANTVDWSEDDEPLPSEDVLGDTDELKRWGRRLGIFDGVSPKPDERELRATHVLRRAVYAVFAAITRGREPPPEALERIASDHAAAASAGSLAISSGVWKLRWPPDESRRLRFAVAVDTLTLLADPNRMPRVRRCPGRGCGWLFLDTSGRRRWCSMTTCGSREKMRRLYHRQHPPRAQN